MYLQERDQESPVVVLTKPIYILILLILSRFTFWMFDVNGNVNSAYIQYLTSIITRKRDASALEEML